MARRAKAQRRGKTDAAHTLTLPDTLDIAAVERLKVDILSRQGEDLVLDASNVQALGGLCLQVLLAAQAAWANQSGAFTIADPSQAFTDAARLAGAAPLLPTGESGVQP